jgi:hypothetical protein
VGLYREWFIERGLERRQLFQLLKDDFPIYSVLYPGSFVHITPSFFFSLVVYVEEDKRAVMFFNLKAYEPLVDQEKIYPEDADIRFHAQDYSRPIPEKVEGFDLLISQYAGFVGQACKTYLKKGGLLLANNSHGDASMALLDGAYELAAVIVGSSERPKLKFDEMEPYITPKKPGNLNREYIEKHRRGVAFLKSASNYLFKRVS